jgi:hypothetical protein
MGRHALRVWKHLAETDPMPKPRDPNDTKAGPELNENWGPRLVTAQEWG